LKMPIHAHFYGRIFISRPRSDRQTHLFDFWSEFIGRSVHARLQVCVQLWFVPKTDRQIHNTHTHTQPCIATTMLVHHHGS